MDAPDRSALVIASGSFDDARLDQLRSPSQDADALARVLGDPGIGAFDVRTMVDAPAHELQSAVEVHFANRRPDDLLLLHISAHGVKDEAGDLYFAAANTDMDRLASTSLPADFVNRRMARSRSKRILLLLDCCYSGAFEHRMTARSGTDMAINDQFSGGRGRAVITASTAMEYAFEGRVLTDETPATPSVFTNALIDGLRTGDADRDQDGIVSLTEMYEFVHDRVRETTPNQTPCKWTYGLQGDLHIARRARPVSTPARLPPEIEEVLGHPLPHVRLAAVDALTELLTGRHAGLVLAARLALERLSNDDSRRVAAAATAALEGGTPAADGPAVATVTPPSVSDPRGDPADLGPEGGAGPPGFGAASDPVPVDGAAEPQAPRRGDAGEPRSWRSELRSADRRTALSRQALPVALLLTGWAFGASVSLYTQLQYHDVLDGWWQWLLVALLVLASVGLLASRRRPHVEPAFVAVGLAASLLVVYTHLLVATDRGTTPFAGPEGVLFATSVVLTLVLGSLSQRQAAPHPRTDVPDRSPWWSLVAGGLLVLWLSTRTLELPWPTWHLLVHLAATGIYLTWLARTCARRLWLGVLALTTLLTLSLHTAMLVVSSWLFDHHPVAFVLNVAALLVILGAVVRMALSSPPEDASVR